ncbi:MAG: NADH-quinone oxidoreductase subunit H [Patescibacteria group bacterium]
MSFFFASLIQLIIIPIFSPLCIGITRMLKARLQKRCGASVLQPYRDLWKLFHKDEVLSVDASWIFRFTPYILCSLFLFVGFNIPLITTAFAKSGSGDFLVLVYCMAFGTFFLALAGLDTGGAFGGFGSSREMMVSSLAEGTLVLSLFVLALLTHTTNMFGISNGVGSLSLSNLAPVVLAFSGFFIALLAETGRYPFDNPSTHLELTMIHEAMILEYSGKRLALIEWAAAQKYMIFLSLAASIFFPYGIAHTFDPIALFIGLVYFAIKICILCGAIALIESSIAKLRIFRLPSLLATSFVICIVALGLTL